MTAVVVGCSVWFGSLVTIIGTNRHLATPLLNDEAHQRPEFVLGLVPPGANRQDDAR